MHRDPAHRFEPPFATERNHVRLTAGRRHLRRAAAGDHTENRVAADHGDGLHVAAERQDASLVAQNHDRLFRDALGLVRVRLEVDRTDA